MQKKKSSRDAAAIAANLMFAPAVMWMRIPTMLSEPRKAGRLGVETMRAIDEKTKAVAVGAAAAQATLTNAVLSFWPELLAGKTPSLWSGEAAENAVNAALLPAGKRVKANFARLSGLARK